MADASTAPPPVAGARLRRGDQPGRVGSSAIAMDARRPLPAALDAAHRRAGMRPGGMPPWAIASAVMAGRLVPATALTLIGAKAPHLLRRVRSVDRVLSEVESGRVTIR
jgi:hypothetical protein